MVKYGIVRFNIPVDTIQVFLELLTNESCFNEVGN